MQDLQGLPTYSPEQCPVCTGRDGRRADAEGVTCDGCEEPIPAYPEVPAGYQSQSITHWHHVSVGGVSGFQPLHDTLCLECYREDWKKVYPDEDLPV